MFNRKKYENVLKKALDKVGFTFTKEELQDCIEWIMAQCDLGVEENQAVMNAVYDIYNCRQYK